MKLKLFLITVIYVEVYCVIEVKSFKFYGLLILFKEILIFNFKKIERYANKFKLKYKIKKHNSVNQLNPFELS